MISFQLIHFLFWMFFILLMEGKTWKLWWRSLLLIIKTIRKSFDKEVMNIQEAYKEILLCMFLVQLKASKGKT